MQCGITLKRIICIAKLSRENPSPTLPFSKGGSNYPLCKRGSPQAGGFAFEELKYKIYFLKPIGN
jgi:hypothetical protein